VIAIDPLELEAALERDPANNAEDLKNEPKRTT
jgi:hypothetical protein